ncbi:MAG: hypothetical protein U1D29_09335 [Burkholderiales bacterium]|nr:hypothetical protein [Burkholderiales bacterium]
MKALIEIAPRGSVFKAARAQLKAAKKAPSYSADYHLSFESARTLFSELTPSRIDLLEALRQCGPCSALMATQIPPSMATSNSPT